jgi:putative component of membrane protein insertase Oxa1/YidC/SpoIIIJ protein YidD
MLTRIVLRLIIAWRKSPSSKIQRMRKNCIYRPSCSAYTFIYIRRFGLFKGIWNGLLRIKRCNATKYLGGVDAVPEK